MATFLVSRLLGLLRDVVIGAQFGTSGNYDAYVAAFRIPDIIYTLIAGGILVSAFVPTFTGYLAKDDRPGAWRLASAVINLVIIALALAALVAVVLAGPIVQYLLAPGFSPEKQALTVQLMQIMLVPPIIFGISGVVMGILRASKFLAAWSRASMYNRASSLARSCCRPHWGSTGWRLGRSSGRCCIC
jgi:putative peptidoglycan lipid II flippase